tara:strand:+ start:392 stop:679 length:288 start_codon:yes stop_codon:yes gene_type:complete
MPNFKKNKKLKKNNRRKEALRLVETTETEASTIRKETTKAKFKARKTHSLHNKLVNVKNYHGNIKGQFQVLLIQPIEFKTILEPNQMRAITLVKI